MSNSKAAPIVDPQTRYRALRSMAYGIESFVKTRDSAAGLEMCDLMDEMRQTLIVIHGESPIFKPNQLTWLRCTLAGMLQVLRAHLQITPNYKADSLIRGLYSSATTVNEMMKGNHDAQMREEILKTAVPMQGFLLKQYNHLVEIDKSTWTPSNWIMFGTVETKLTQIQTRRELLEPTFTWGAKRKPDASWQPSEDPEVAARRRETREAKQRRKAEQATLHSGDWISVGRQTPAPAAQPSGAAGGDAPRACAFLRGQWAGKDTFVLSHCTARAGGSAGNCYVDHDRLAYTHLSREDMLEHLLNEEAAGELERYPFLNDSVIIAYMTVLQVRNEHRRGADGGHPRCEFFITNATPLMFGYDMERFDTNQAWSYSKRLPALSSVDRLLFPVNTDNMHWVLVVVFPKLRTVCMYDSMGGGVGIHTQRFVEYAKEVCRKQVESNPDSPDAEELAAMRDARWTQAHHRGPPQSDGYNCGMFVCANADWLSRRPEGTLDEINDDAHAGYTQDDMPQLRRALRDLLSTCDMRRHEAHRKAAPAAAGAAADSDDDDVVCMGTVGRN